MSEINVANELNNILSSKQKVVKRVTATVKEKHCEPWEGNPRRLACREIDVEKSVDVSVPARVASTRILFIDNIHFDQERLTALPERIHLARKEIRNPSSASINSTVSLTISATSSWSVSKTQGISTTEGGSFALRHTIPNFGSADLTLNWSSTISTSSTVAEGYQTAVTRSMSDSVFVKPYSSVIVEFLVFESSAQIPFTARAVVDGNMEPNMSNITQASQLLNEDERTFTISGVLSIADVSNGMIRVEDLPPLEQASTQSGAVVHEITDLVSNWANIGPTYLEQFEVPSKLRRGDQGKGSLRSRSSDEDNGPVITQPDGIHHTVLYTTEVVRPTPACGFNDVGLMNVGIFSSEAREYREYVGGVLTRVWQEVQETLKTCYTP